MRRDRMNIAFKTPSLMLDVDKCSGCGMCKIVCPQNVFEFHNRQARVGDRDACTACGECVQHCFGKAISVLNMSENITV